MRVLRFERFSEKKVYSLSTLCRAWNIKQASFACFLASLSARIHVTL